MKVLARLRSGSNKLGVGAKVSVLAKDLSESWARQTFPETWETERLENLLVLETKHPGSEPSSDPVVVVEFKGKKFEVCGSLVMVTQGKTGFNPVPDDAEPAPSFRVIEQTVGGDEDGCGDEDDTNVDPTEPPSSSFFTVNYFGSSSK